MNEFKKTFEIKPDLKVTIARLYLKESFLEKCKMIPIANDAYFTFARTLRNEPLTMPKLYTGLRHLTGPSDECYDD